MTVFVLDNSVTVRWCFDAGQHPYADGIQSRLQAPSGRAFVPIVWRYEVSNVLVRAQKSNALPAQAALDFISDLQALEIVTDLIGVEHILTNVHLLATAYQLTSYDAAYLELALRRNLPLATLDKDLARACQAAGGTIL